MKNDSLNLKYLKSSCMPEPSSLFNIQDKSNLLDITGGNRINNKHWQFEHKLPVMEALLDKALHKIDSNSLKNTAIVYIHHPLETSVNVLQAMIYLGADPKNIFVLGKHYSECPTVVEKIIKLGVYYQPCSAQTGIGRFSQSFICDVNWLWSNALNKIQKEVNQFLILDHGGCALNFIPAPILEKYKVIGVEKTTAGLINFETQGLPSFPVISVASCATKKFLESSLIADAIVKKLESFIPLNNNLICGVIGYGVIGKAVSNRLLTMGHKLIVYDNDPRQLARAEEKKEIKTTNELSALIAFSDYIFGCTGRDISKSTDLFRLSNHDKTLISCSSEDKEFLSLLQMIQQRNFDPRAINPLANIKYQTDFGATIHILRGGFPINFDHSGESVPANDIQLTRALVLSSILQAIEFFKKDEMLSNAGIYALDPKVQNFIISEWLKYQPINRFSKNLINVFQNIAWISENSGGIHVPFNIL